MDQQKCAGFGFGPGSDAFAQCMMSTAQQRDAQQAADRRAWQERQARDAEAKAANANANASAGQATPPPPQKQKCTSTTTTVGNTTTTHEECSSSSW